MTFYTTTVNSYSKYFKAYRWCMEQFGTNPDWIHFWTVDGNDKQEFIFKFVDKEAFILFVLRWS